MIIGPYISSMMFTENCQNATKTKTSHFALIFFPFILLLFYFPPFAFFYQLPPSAPPRPTYPPCQSRFNKLYTPQLRLVCVQLGGSKRDKTTRITWVNFHKKFQDYRIKSCREVELVSWSGAWSA